MKKLLVLLLLVTFLSGCGGNMPNENPGATAAQPASEKSEEVNADAIYDKIKTGMTLEEVQSIIGKEPISEAESTADTSIGDVKVENYSWQVGNTLITVIFENGKVTMKNKTNIN